MIALPIKYISGSQNKYPLVYVIRLDLLNNGVPNVLYVGSDVALSGSNAYYSGSQVDIQPQYLAAVVKDMNGESDVDGIGEIDYEINLQQGGSVSTVNETSVILLNQGEFSEEHKYDIENQYIEIWKGYLPMSGSVPSGSIHVDQDFILKFKGVTNNVGEYGYDKFIIPAVDARKRESKTLPSNRIDNMRFPGAPKETQGKVMPFVFGDFYSGNDIEYNVQDVIPSYTIDNTGFRFLFSEDNLDTASFAPYYISSDGFTGRITSSYTHHRSASEGYGDSIQLSDSYGRWHLYGTYADFYLQFDAITADSYGTGINPPFDGHKVVDGDDSTSTVLAGAGAALFGITKVPNLTLIGNEDARSMLTGIIKTDLRVILKTKNRVGSPLLKIITPGGTDPIYTYAITTDLKVLPMTYHFLQSQNYSWATLEGTQFGVECPTVNDSIEIESLFIQVRCETGDMAKSGRGYNSVKKAMRPFTGGRGREPIINPKLGFQVSLAAADNVAASSNVFAIGRGFVFKDTDTWILGRGNGYSTGSLIDNPAYVIEYLLRNKLPILSNQIYTASFDVVGNTTNGTRKDWKLAGIINTEKDAFEHIKDICFEFGLQCIKTNSSQYKLVAMDSGSAVYTIQTADIQFDGIPKIDLATTTNDNLVNDINIDYRTDYASNDTRGNIYMSDVNSDGILETNFQVNSGSLRDGTYTAWLDDSRTRYSSVKSYTTTLQYIRDAATAELSVKKYLDWSAFKRLVVKMTKVVPTLNTLALEVGDIIKINVDILSQDYFNTVTFMITRINYPPVGKTGQPYFTIECEEIPNENTGTPVLISQFISSEDLSIA